MLVDRRHVILAACVGAFGISRAAPNSAVLAGPAGPQLDIRQFGAQPRAGFNNVRAIGAACRAAAAGGGGVIVPEGRFEVSEVRLPAGLRSISGPGWLVGISAAPEAVVTAGVGGPAPHGAWIGLNIDCGGRARRGFFARGLVASRIEGCRVRNLAFDGGDAIRLQYPGCRDNLVARNEIELPDGDRFPAGLFGIHVVGETASPTGGIERRGSPVRPPVSVRDTVVADNRVTGGSHGIAFFGAAGFACERNTCTRQSARNIIASPTCTDGRIAGNTCLDAGSSAIHVALGCERIVITDNAIRSARASLRDDDDGAIQAYADCRSVLITDNTITGDWRYGIYIAVAQNVVIQGNRIDANAFSGPAIAVESGWHSRLPTSARFSRARSVGYRFVLATTDITVRDNEIVGGPAAIALAQIGGRPLRDLHLGDERVSQSTRMFLYAVEQDPGLLSDIRVSASQARARDVIAALPRGAAHLVSR